MLPRPNLIYFVKNDKNLKKDKELLSLVNKYKRTIGEPVPWVDSNDNIEDYKNALKKEIEEYIESGRPKGEREVVDVIENLMYFNKELKTIKEEYIVVTGEAPPKYIFVDSPYAYYSDIKKYKKILRDEIKKQAEPETIEAAIKRRENEREIIEKILLYNDALNLLKDDYLIYDEKIKKIRKTYSKDIENYIDEPMPEYNFDKYCYRENIPKYIEHFRDKVMEKSDTLYLLEEMNGILFAFWDKNEEE